MSMDDCEIIDGCDSLAKNDIKDEGAVALGAMLLENKTLKKLS